MPPWLQRQPLLTEDLVSIVAPWIMTLRTRVAPPGTLGYVMPAEWTRHAGCLMAWPNRVELWGEQLDEAQRDYSLVARAIARFEPVVMVCNPRHEQDGARALRPGRDTARDPDQRLVGTGQRPGVRPAARGVRRRCRGWVRFQRLGQSLASPRRRRRAQRTPGRVARAFRTSMHRSCWRVDRSSSTARER